MGADVSRRVDGWWPSPGSGGGDASGVAAGETQNISIETPLVQGVVTVTENTAE
jgi:hypothetical protein